MENNVVKNLGKWDINLMLGLMPQKVATAFTEVTEKLVGSVYEPIAYLGSQIAHGTNHAVLAIQRTITSADHKNIVLMKFNEVGMDCVLYAIETVIQEGAPFGGYVIDTKFNDDIPEDANEAFDDVRTGWVGYRIDKVGLLATKVSKGTDYVFLAKTEGMDLHSSETVSLVIINRVIRSLDVIEIL